MIEGNKEPEKNVDGASTPQSQDLSELSTRVSGAIVQLSRDIPALISQMDKLDPQASLDLKKALQEVVNNLSPAEQSSDRISDRLLQQGKRHFRLHPWHGVDAGAHAPSMVNAFIEITPTDTIKFELDKESGHLKIDRPQLLSNVLPANYGFIPRTYCGDEIAALSNERTGRTDIVGDGDPLDICVYMERPLPHGNVLMEVVPIGGFRMIDNGEADDKIIAVLKNDPQYGDIKDITNLSQSVIDRLRHYFLTYKDMPGGAGRVCHITHIYGRDEALEVIKCAQKDYQDSFK